MTLLNFVLNSIPIYIFSFYKAPKCVLQEIIRIQRDFLWGGVVEKRNMVWISWLIMCKLKSQGGLGIKHCDMFNISLLCKWKWRILNEPNSIWSGLFLLRYEDINTKILGVDRKVPNKFDSLWWRDLDLVGPIENEDSNWFTSYISCRLGNRLSLDF